jgi:hypothetical protein
LDINKSMPRLLLTAQRARTRRQTGHPKGFFFLADMRKVCRPL